MAEKSAKDSPKNTRSRKGSLKDSTSNAEILELLRESEERIKKCIKAEISLMTEKLTTIETALSSVQSECARIDNEILKVKEVIYNQQVQIEKNEQRLRSNNIIVHNIPETNVSTASVQLKDDSEKLRFLCRSADININKDDVISTRRLGKRSSGKSRPLKIELRNRDQKYEFLNKRRHIITNQELQRCFESRIFVNPDNSFLVQKEEYRLRERLKRLKAEEPNLSCYIRSGTLYQEGKMIDKIDFRHQLF